MLPALLLALATPPSGALAAEIGLDLGRLDGDGLHGPPDGRRSLDYEYCVPDTPAARAEVANIDASARFLPGSPGRIGCGRDEILVLGNTHQPGFREVINALADLPSVERIIEAHFD